MRSWLFAAALPLAALPGGSCRSRSFCKPVGESCADHGQCCSFGCGDFLGNNPAPAPPAAPAS